MIKFENGQLVAGTGMEAFNYIQGRGFLGRCVLPITRRLRVRNVMRYATTGRDHLDIGCGDGYFLRRSPCRTAVGMDMRIGDSPVGPGSPLPFGDEMFDLVTMLAVIEHVKDPQFVISEVARVLRPKGRLVLTTPKQAAEWLIHLYVKDIEEEHESYFTQQRLEQLVRPKLVPAGYHTFLFGLNQAFAATKPD
jgi:2-polyprenyl-3-methyl-5-hydroxy-6-metoxy-1,4-benzoquinol methylase